MQEELELILPGEDGFIEFNNDPIAVAIVRSEGKDFHIDLKDIDNDPRTEKIIITGEYLERAENIRKFYKQKLFLGTFKNRFKRTLFREHLQKALERKNKHKLHFTEVGMIAKLPEFYIQDIVKNEIREMCKTNTPFSMTLYNKTLKVEYIRSTITRFGGEVRYNHWFKTDDNKAVQFTLEYRNPLIDLFDYYLKKNKIFYLKGDFFCSEDEDFYYYTHSGQIAIPN